LPCDDIKKLSRAFISCLLEVLKLFLKLFLELLTFLVERFLDGPELLLQSFTFLIQQLVLFGDDPKNPVGVFIGGLSVLKKFVS